MAIVSPHQNTFHALLIMEEKKEGEIKSVELKVSQFVAQSGQTTDSKNLYLCLNTKIWFPSNVYSLILID